MSARVIDMMKREDERLSEVTQYLVPIPHGTGANDPSGMAAVPRTSNPPIWDKFNYAQLYGIPRGQIKTHLEITDEDVQSLKDKAYAATNWQFNNYIGRLYKPNESPANKAFLKQVYPEWFDIQKKTIDNYHDEKKRIEKIKLMGPSNKEELFTMYRLDATADPNAQDLLPMGHNKAYADYLAAVPSVGAVSDTAAQQKTKFQRGLFNYDREQLTAKALSGYAESVWPAMSGAGATVNNPIKTATFDPARYPMGVKYGQPHWWTEGPMAQQGAIANWEWVETTAQTAANVTAGAKAPIAHWT
jgi:hypothetical protein